MRKFDVKTANEQYAKQIRSNPDRYYHIMAEGWYIFTREGIKEPFYDKSRAALFLQQHIHGPEELPDPSAAWRL